MLGDRFIVALTELGGDGRVIVRMVCAGGQGGLFPGVEVEGCSWMICLFEGGHRFACSLDLSHAHLNG